MSKNPAWAAYNEAVEKANAEYDKTVEPLRQKHREGLIAVEKEFAPKFEELRKNQTEKNRKLREEFDDQVRTAVQKRNAAISAAQKTLSTETRANIEIHPANREKAVA